MRLLIVDDHPLFVEGFAAMLQHSRPNWQLHACAHGDAALQLLADSSFDLVVIDVMLPDRSGFEVLEAITQQAPHVLGLLISGRDQAAMRQRARNSTARGFISKTAPTAQIVASLEHVLGGGTVFDDLPDSDIAPVLTTRQAEILMLLAEGHGNKEIRYRLGIAERTVRAHLTELFNILGVHGRMPAVIRGRELGLIE